MDSVLAPAAIALLLIDKVPANRATLSARVDTSLIVASLVDTDLEDVSVEIALNMKFSSINDRHF